MSDSKRGPTLIAKLVGGFAVLALLLAAVGVYGVIAYAVSLRTREFGVRLALGARRATLIGQVLRSGLLLAALGIALGTALALALGRAVQDLLYQVSPYEPGILATVAAFAVRAVPGEVRRGLPAAGMVAVLAVGFVRLRDHRPRWALWSAVAVAALAVTGGIVLLSSTIVDTRLDRVLLYRTAIAAAIEHLPWGGGGYAALSVQSLASEMCRLSGASLWTLEARASDGRNLRNAAREMAVDQISQWSGGMHELITTARSAISGYRARLSWRAPSNTMCSYTSSPITMASVF